MGRVHHCEADEKEDQERLGEMNHISEDVVLDVGYRVDILIEKKVILELKAVEKLLPIHQAQILSYLKLSNCKLGFLMNFNVYRMKDGVRRLVNNL